MTPEHRNAAIRALSRKMIKCMDNQSVDVCGAALGTVIVTFLLDLTKSEADALGGLEAIKDDAATFIRLAHIHKGTRQ